MPFRAISRAASPAVASAGSVIAGALITSRIGAVERALRQHDAADHVLPREHAERLRVGIDDRHRADPVPLHRLERVAERRVGAAGDRLLPEQVGEPRREAPLLGQRRGVLGLQLRARQVEQVGEAARAEVLEDRRRGDQRVEHRGREHQAERVLRGAVDAGDAAVPQQRAQREHLAGGELPQRRRRARASGALAAHRALPDDVAVRGPLLRRRQDRLARGEVAQLRRADDPLEIALGHRRERRMRLQRLLQAGENGWCGDRGLRHASGSPSSDRVTPSAGPSPRTTAASRAGRRGASGSGGLRASEFSGWRRSR